MYPNPVTAQRNLLLRFPSSVAGVETAVFRIYDILGRRVKEQRFSPLHDGTELSVNVEQLVSGTYFVVLHVGGQTVAKKFIVLK